MTYFKGENHKTVMETSRNKNPSRLTNEPKKAPKLREKY